MENKEHPYPIMLTVVVAVCMIIVIFIAGQFVYGSSQFKATVDEIEFIPSGGLFGGTNAVVRFGDGSALTFYESKIPDGLASGHTYILEHRIPYLIASDSLVIIEEIK